MDKVRFGIIGCGTVASYGHIPGILAARGAELAAIADVRQSRLDELRREHPIVDAYADYHDLLSRSDIDAVAVAVPLPMHRPVVLDAAAAGKHVLCEKPIAPTVREGEEMVAMMERAGRLLAINFERRCTEPFPTMKRLLEEGRIGRLKVIRCVGNWQGGRWAGAERYRMLITEGLGPVVDCGIHDFDFVRWVSGSEFAEVRASGTHIEDWPNPDHVLATCRMEDGTLAHIETGWAYTHNTPCHEANLRIDLIGEEGLLSHVNWQSSIEGQPNIHEFSVYSKDGCSRRPVTTGQKSFDRMYTLMAESIGAGALSGLPSGHDGVRALEAALEALGQAREGPALDQGGSMRQEL